VHRTSVSWIKIPLATPIHTHACMFCRRINDSGRPWSLVFTKLDVIQTGQPHPVDRMEDCVEQLERLTATLLPFIPTSSSTGLGKDVLLKYGVIVGVLILLYGRHYANNVSNGNYLPYFQVHILLEARFQDAVGVQMIIIGLISTIMPSVQIAYVDPRWQIHSMFCWSALHLSSIIV
jgi:hypothetical protein